MTRVTKDGIFQKNNKARGTLMYLTFQLNSCTVITDTKTERIESIR
jgi:hypothetical protein